MLKQSCTSTHFFGHFALIASMAVLSACANNAATNVASDTSASSVASVASTLAISPTSISLSQGVLYPFETTGGSGSYTYSVPSNEGSIGYYTGLFTTPSNWTGTTTVQVTDSLGATATATIYVTTASTTTTTSTSLTGTLTNCAGVTGGYYGQNNWEVNGSELRTINDPNYYLESPINCTGLSIAGSIPSGATITGVSVGLFMINQSSTYDGSTIQSVNLLSAGSVVGNVNAQNINIPGNKAVFPTFTQGSYGDTWGASLTPAIVNAADFGVTIQAVRATNRLFLGEASTVAPQVTIYYSY